MVEILPSILSADFARLGEQVSELEAVGCRMLHVDVMDGHFVPNITLGPPVVKSLRKATKMKLDVHLMIEDPDTYAPQFIDAGADLVSVHQEACRHLDRTLRMIQDRGARAGVVINPATPIDTLDEALEIADFVLLMSVNPGFGGQKFIDVVVPKIRRARELVKGRDLSLWIQVDGGVAAETIEVCADAGADVFVAGSAVYGAADPAAAIQALRASAERATAASWWCPSA